MAHATLHAIALLGLPALTAVACFLGWKAKPSFRKTVGALGMGLAFLLVCSLIPAHLCTRGEAVTQPIVGALCLIAAVLCVSNDRVAAIACLVILILSSILTRHYAALVHAENLTGNPGEPAHSARVLENRMTRLRQPLERGTAFLDQTYPAEWLHRLDLAEAHAELKEPLRSGEPTRIEVSPLWHSWITRLYGRREHPVRAWYPGGTLRNSIAGIEWRDYGP